MHPLLIAAATWTLITLSYGGVVRHSEGFSSLALCQEAKSIALTGLTIEDNKAEDEALARRIQDFDVAWRKTHPPRKPTASERKSLSMTATMTANYPYSTIGDDGLVYQWPGDQCGGGIFAGYDPNRGEGVVFIRCRIIHKYAMDVKAAECVKGPRK